MATKNRLTAPGHPNVLGVTANAGSLAQLTLQNAYVHHSGGSGGTGEALAIRFAPPCDGTLEWVQIFIDSKINNPTAVLNLNLCAFDASSTGRPGAIVTNGSASATPDTVTPKWLKFTFDTQPSVLMAQGVYWLMCGAATTDAVNQWRLRLTGSIAPPFDKAADLLLAFTTTNGGQSVSLSNGGGVIFVAKFNGNDGKTYYIGNPYTTNGSALFTANTKARGLKISNLSETIEVCGVSFNQLPSTIGSYRIYKGAGTAVGGTPILNVSWPNGALQNAIGTLRHAPVRLHPNETYRCVFLPGSATNLPLAFNVEDSNADVLMALPYGGDIIGTIEDTPGTGWVDQPLMPAMRLYVHDVGQRGLVVPLIAYPA